ncbi:MAG: hypothetical protein IKW78_05655 [Prevotella sp.]|nr:hypothetical protein [Prevotella sp.]
MKKVVFALFLTSLVLFSCSGESVEVDSVNQQTILVYMPWSGSESHSGLYPNFKQNLDSIESAIKNRKGLGKTRALIFISESASTSKLYEIRYEENACKRELLKTYTGRDYTSAEGIASILTDTKNAAEALNYALIVGCHGTGWTYVSDWQDYPNSAKSHALRVKRNRPSDDRFERTRFFGSVDDNRFATDIETLADGIRKSGLHLQFILFDDCYMANAEVAYELRNVTNFLIASTSEIMAIGMPYADMWKSLNVQAPNYKSAVEAFHSFYSNYRSPYGTIAAIDCRQMDNLAAVMKQINEHYALDESLFEEIQVLDGFDDPIFFDMGDYVAKLCTDPYLYEKFTAQMAKTVVNKANTPQIYSYLYWSSRTIDVNTFSGITISDPSRHVVAQRGKERTSWWKATH